LFIQTTEALTVIDVNSGKFTNSATQDETILKTNLEAVQEIARQLRLRNIGGMIIIDFIDMTSRIDKLTMMEALELAVEADKAKPQVGQLSDLGLVEMTRHRQGQAISEIFAKRCPHCQGNGYIMEDLKFASATSEGEYRAKAAKIKLPMNDKKRFPNNKFNNKSENKQEEVKDVQPVVQEPVLEQTKSPSVTAQEAVKEIQEEKAEKKVKATRGRGRKKVKEAEVIADNIAQTVLPKDAEIAPVIAKDASDTKDVKPIPSAPTEATLASEAEQVEKQSKRSRRPNRNSQKTQKRTRRTTKKNVEE